MMGIGSDAIATGIDVGEKILGLLFVFRRWGHTAFREIR